MLQNLTYSYLVAWIVGGLSLVTMLLLRTQRRPYALSFALIAFGGTGFVSLGLGLGTWDCTLVYALVACGACAVVGYVVQPQAVVAPSPPSPEPPAPPPL